MTAEELKIVQDMLQAYKESYVVIGIGLAIWLIATILLCAWEFYRLKTMKKMHNEWKCSLTEDQIKIINKNKEYTK